MDRDAHVVAQALELIETNLEKAWGQNVEECWQPQKGILLCGDQKRCK